MAELRAQRRAVRVELLVALAARKGALRERVLGPAMVATRVLEAWEPARHRI
jgi:hypothetical protein